MAYRFDDLGRLDGVAETPQGGIEAPAFLTRAGIFIYRADNGTERRELRPASEVFDANSLATLRGAPLVVGHPGMVTAENWKEYSVGHVGDEVKEDGGFVRARVRVQDSTVKERVKRKDLSELSCGYTCDMDETPGVYQGQKYDAVQKNIRYNHVGLGPPGWGRAGGEVRLRMDGVDHTVVVGRPLEPSTHTVGMSESGKEAVVETPVAPATVTVHVDGAEVERLRGENDALKAEVAALKAQVSPERIDGLVNSRIELQNKARKLLGAEAKFDGLSDTEVMAKAIGASDKSFRMDGKSAEYVLGRFEAVVALEASASDATSKVRTDAVNAPSEKKNELEDARARNEARSKDAWKQPLTVTRGN